MGNGMACVVDLGTDAEARTGSQGYEQICKRADVDIINLLRYSQVSWS